MTRHEFDMLLARRQNLMRETLAVKAQEYSSEDRLHNFKVAAKMTGTSTELALWGMMVKHLVSVRDMVLDPAKASPARVDEKIGDLINYIVLLEAVFREVLDDRD